MLVSRYRAIRILRSVELVSTVPAYRCLHPMVQVYMGTEPAMVCLMVAGAIRGFAEDLVLAEVSAEAGVEAGEFGGRLKLANNCRKDGNYAKR